MTNLVFRLLLLQLVAGMYRPFIANFVTQNQILSETSVSRLTVLKKSLCDIMHYSNLLLAFDSGAFLLGCTKKNLTLSDLAVCWQKVEFGSKLSPIQKF